MRTISTEHFACAATVCGAEPGRKRSIPRISRGPRRCVCRRVELRKGLFRWATRCASPMRLNAFRQRLRNLDVKQRTLSNMKNFHPAGAPRAVARLHNEPATGSRVFIELFGLFFPTIIADPFLKTSATGVPHRSSLTREKKSM
ncbi:MAG: hypothetical protein SF339_10910 [Blastocatellia bacterium]|nr:hypothetical protein [Blastocatellia bacterium]